METHSTITKNRLSEVHMAKKKNEDMLETTTEIKQGHANIGKFNIAVQVILTVVCIVYLILHFSP